MGQVGLEPTLCVVNRNRLTAGSIRRSGTGPRRNGETRTHDPLVPNQVRYLLRYIPLEGVLLTDETKTITQNYQS